MPHPNDAPNVYSNYKVVQAVTNPELIPLGDIGDDAHQAGGGDHTFNSTHRGKRGYPTQGQIHAWDMDGPAWLLDLYETFIRRSWRRGELFDVKYINVLRRHWNNQSLANWELAKAGTLVARYSADHHAHTSMENGTGDGNLIIRFLAWVLAGQRFPDEVEMALSNELVDLPAAKDAVPLPPEARPDQRADIILAWTAVRVSNLQRDLLAVKGDMAAMAKAVNTFIASGGVNTDELARKVAAGITANQAAANADEIKKRLES